MQRTLVLLVEDHPMSRLMAVDALERGGFEVADFARTDEVLPYAEQMPERIAALVADIGLPGDQDGLDLANSFAARWPETPILITSGLFGRDPPSGLPLAASFLPKPWTARMLMDRLASLCGSAPPGPA